MTRPTWLPVATTELVASIIEEAREHVGVTEDPLGSNRSPEIDRYLKDIGVPPGNPWCAAWVTAVFKKAGAAVPPGPGASSTDTWLAWAKVHDLWTRTPTLGAAVIYGRRDDDGKEDAQHIGIVVRITPMVLTIEGNRGFGGVTAEGVAVDLGPLSTTWVLGYARPAPVTA